MSKEIVTTENAPAAVGPYSQAVVTGELVYTSGQIALHPSSGELVEGDIRTQTRQALENLKSVLEGAGSSLERAIKTTVFLQDISDYSAMNEVYGEFFTSNQPARSAVEVGALPLGAQIEIEAVAVRKSGEE